MKISYLLLGVSLFTSAAALAGTSSSGGTLPDGFQLVCKGQNEHGVGVNIILTDEFGKPNVDVEAIDKEGQSRIVAQLDVKGNLTRHDGKFIMEYSGEKFLLRLNVENKVDGNAVYSALLRSELEIAARSVPLACTANTDTDGGHQSTTEASSRAR